MIINKINRAKQFMPFDTLNGLQKAYREKEILNEEKRELSEEIYIELEEKLKDIQIGEEIEIKYYKFKRYVETRGIITKKDYLNKRIYLNKDIEINIYDVLDVKKKCMP